MPNWFSRLIGREEKASVPPGLIALQFAARAAWSPRDIPALMREGYERNAITHRCVRLIAEAAAAVPLKASNAAAQRLIDQPNPDQSGPELWESFYGFLQLAGNAYLELASLEGEPRELFVLRPDRLRVLPGPRGWPQGWEYSVDGRKRRFERDPVSGRAPVFHIKLFHPGDDYYGLSPIQAAARALDLHNAGGEWAKALLDNAARPSGALVFNGGDGRMSEDQFNRIKHQLAEDHGGPANAGRPMLLEGGLDWKPMALSPADMDFTQARREAAREIALAFGVPPLLLGLPGDNTYANYREANLAFWRQTVSPLTRKMARALAVWLRPWFGPDLVIEADESGVPGLKELDQ
ncbi:phage portal protein [Maricaulis salignorans]|uniref:Phage portal protein, HK97 family n=1 Tax=Maricaulis salignorans TaxID=144026 RepID=A0A1G9Q330_9PROT|nr:phage portal protein [Maricaulis salignorans]SDM05448.1 phage portal protein, HK97 family [Maricaulis salignorans]